MLASLRTTLCNILRNFASIFAESWYVKTMQAVQGKPLKHAVFNTNRCESQSNLKWPQLIKYEDQSQ